jgi:cell division protein FtsQ
MSRKIKIITAVLAVMLIAGGLIFSFRIKNITVQGNAWYTDEEIAEEILSGPMSDRSVVIFLKNLLGRKESIPFIEDYSVSFTSTDSIEIIVYEKSIVGYVEYMSSNMYFDKDGIVVESSYESLSGIPQITGLEFGSIVLYKKLPVSDARVFENILNLTQMLSVNGIGVDRINYSEMREATLYIDDIVVELGTDEEMNGKISELADMLPKLEGMSGTLYLDTYDKNNDNAAYSFKLN